MVLRSNTLIRVRILQPFSVKFCIQRTKINTIELSRWSLNLKVIKYWLNLLNFVHLFIYQVSLVHDVFLQHGRDVLVVVTALVIDDRRSRRRISGHVTPDAFRHLTDLDEWHVVVIVHTLGRDPAKPSRIGRWNGRNEREEVGLRQVARPPRDPAERHRIGSLLLLLLLLVLVTMSLIFHFIELFLFGARKRTTRWPPRLQKVEVKMVSSLLFKSNRK